MQRIVDALVTQLRERGVTLLTNTPVDEIARNGNKWSVETELFDAVVVATPAFAAAKLLSVVAPDASDVLAAIPYASVAMIRLAVTTRMQSTHHSTEAAL